MSHRATSSQEWQCDLHLPETAALIAEGNTGLTLVTLTGPLHVHIHVEGKRHRNTLNGAIQQCSEHC